MNVDETRCTVALVSEAIPMADLGPEISPNLDDPTYGSSIRVLVVGSNAVDKFILQ